MTEPSTLELFHSDQLKHFERIKKRLVWMYPQSEDMAWLIHRLEVLHDWHRANREVRAHYNDVYAVIVCLMNIVERAKERYPALKAEAGFYKWKIKRAEERALDDIREASLLCIKHPENHALKELLKNMRERHEELRAPLP